MFTQDEYLWGWIYYLIGASLVYFCFWMLTRNVPWREPKHILRIVVFVILYMPWYSDTQYIYLSPAWLIGAIEAVFDGSDAFWRAGTPLIIGVVVALTLSLSWSVGRWYLKNKGAKSPSQPATTEP